MHEYDLSWEVHCDFSLVRDNEGIWPEWIALDDPVPMDNSIQNKRNRRHFSQIYLPLSDIPDSQLIITTIQRIGLCRKPFPTWAMTRFRC